jgi:enoyl-CoA hydratase/carnithine racemase
MPTSLRDRVSVDFDDSLAVVRLNRPDKYNALDFPMMDALIDAARLVRRQRDIRAVIVCGQGPAFCSGLDFASVMRQPWKVFRSFLPWFARANRFQRLCLAWRDLPMPVIAATHGYCFGGGFQIALGCDMRISSPDCEFSIMEIEWGLIPDMGASVVLRDLLPLDQALELTLSGRRFSAEEALGFNLITRIDDDPESAARELAASFAERSPSAVAAAKRLLTRTRQGSERRALRRERRGQLGLLLGFNQREAMRARMDKRPPRFRPQR